MRERREQGHIWRESRSCGLVVVGAGEGVRGEGAGTLRFGGGRPWAVCTSASMLGTMFVHVGVLGADGLGVLGAVVFALFAGCANIAVEHC